MTEKIILLILTVIIGFFSAQLSVSRVEMKVDQLLLNQNIITNYKNSLEPIIPLRPPPIPMTNNTKIISMLLSCLKFSLDEIDQYDQILALFLFFP